jgi:transcriptional regulator with XRE-family HTH domain
MELRTIRLGLALTQDEMAQLMGVHKITISKWERLVAKPSAYHQEFYDAFRRALSRVPGLGQAIPLILYNSGVTQALYVLLESAYKKKV